MCMALAEDMPCVAASLARMMEQMATTGAGKTPSPISS